MALRPPRTIHAQPLDVVSYVPAPVGWGPDLVPTDAGNYALMLDNMIPKTGRITMRNPLYSDYGDWVNDATESTALGLTQNKSFAVRGDVTITDPSQTAVQSVSNYLNAPPITDYSDAPALNNPWTFQTDTANNRGWYTNDAGTSTQGPTPLYVMTNCGFNIPANATITGVAVQSSVDGAFEGVGAGVPIVDAYSMLYYNGARYGANRADTGTLWGTPIMTKYYGSSTDLWGATLTPAIVNDASFGYCVAAQSLSSSSGAEVGVGYITMTIYYTVPTGVGGSVAITAIANYGTNGVNVLSHDETLWAKPTAALSLRTNQICPVLGNGTLYWSSKPGAINAPAGSTETTAYITPGKSQTTLYGITWFVSSPTTDFEVTNSSYYIGLTRLGYISPAANTVLNEVTSANTPTCCTSVRAYQSRVWALGGYALGAATSSWSSTALFFSNPVAPTAPTNPLNGSAWQDPVAGTENVIYVSPDENDPGMGLASFNNRLLIFRRHSIYVLTGSTPANYAVTLLSHNFGCVDQESIVETDQGVYFMSDNGLCLTTGTGVKNVSGMATESLTAAVAQYISNPGGDITAALLASGSILVSIRQNAKDSRSATTIWSGVFVPATGTWWRLTSVLFSMYDSSPSGGSATQDGLPGRIICMRETQHCVSIGARRAVDVDYALAGANSNVPRVINGVENDRVSGRQTLFEICNNYGATGTTEVAPIPARWMSPFVPLSPNGRFLVASVRFWVDYLFAVDALSTTTARQIPVALIDPDGESIASTELTSVFSAVRVAPTKPVGDTSVSAMTAGWPMIQRSTDSTYSDITHCHVLLDVLGTWGSSSTDGNAYKVFDIYGAALEFQLGRNLDTA